MEEKTAAAPREELPLRLEELLRRASRDALSGLLNRDTMEREIRRRLAALLPEEACALFEGLGLIGFFQQDESISESFIPAFDGTGLEDTER